MYMYDAWCSIDANESMNMQYIDYYTENKQQPQNDEENQNVADVSKNYCAVSVNDDMSQPTYQTLGNEDKNEGNEGKDPHLTL